jgi:hypothetical protein
MTSDDPTTPSYGERTPYFPPQQYQPPQHRGPHQGRPVGREQLMTLLMTRPIKRAAWFAGSGLGLLIAAIVLDNIGFYHGMSAGNFHGLCSDAAQFSYGLYGHTADCFTAGLIGVLATIAIIVSILLILAGGAFALLWMRDRNGIPGSQAQTGQQGPPL